MRKLAIGALVIAAVAGSSEALAAGRPSGTYKTTVRSTSVPRLNGTWTIKFRHGRYRVSDNGTSAVLGKFSIKSSRITFHDTSGPAACPGKGTYRYRLRGKTLRLTNLTDKSSACLGRQVVLKGKFTKIG